ncbi:MAG: DUF3604 domain-containing protein [Gammaproteobacteria bacterium]|jgi:hypothetical protein
MRQQQSRSSARSSARRIALAAGFITAGLATAAGAQTNLYWGDLHVHTNFSLDAYGVANTYVTPDEAYRFARGIPIYHETLDIKVQIDRPLDFLAVTDHASNLGVDLQVVMGDELMQATEWGRAAIDAANDDTPWPGLLGYRRSLGPDGNAMMEQLTTLELRQSAWQKEIDAAVKNYIPGTFTTFTAWEWTAMIEGKNLHRNVITNAGADANEFYPYSAGQFFSLDGIDSNRPEALWSWLDETAARTGTDFIAIPHNSNISAGLMFDTVDSDGRPISGQYASDRMRWESLVEITQMKGTSEIRPSLAPTDEFANYEIRRKLLIGTPTPPDAGDYVRTALMRGLEIESQVGENPYRFGFVGATDGHIGMSSVEENNFYGKIATDAKLSQHLPRPRPVIFPAWEMSASGLTGVWAEENTRESIFAAMKRKEVYATTGPRIALRVFGGFNFDDDDARADDIASVGYDKGVPMGSDLTAAPRRSAPGLLIHAAKDPVGANLDRVQVIKGWLDDNNEAQQRVYDVVWSGDRVPGANGKVPSVGNTVDISTALYTNDIGATQLAAVWTDPDFDREQTAFYYVRVIEIPTPRHSLYDAVALGIDPEVTAHPATIQERAYSSPIWYTP